VAANMGRKAVSDLLYVCRGAFNGNTDANSRFSTNLTNNNRVESDNRNQKHLLSIGLNCAIYYKELLESIQSVFIYFHKLTSLKILNNLLLYIVIDITKKFN
jgi:hypothetical protein